MDHYNESTFRTLFWCRVNENPKFNSKHEEVIEARKKVAAADHDFSPVYRKSHKAPGRVGRAQILQFRLAKPLMIIENDSDSSPSGMWSGHESHNIVDVPSRKSVDFGSGFNPILLLKRGMFCISRIWILRSRIMSKSSSSQPSLSSTIISSASRASPSSRLSDLAFVDMSSSSTPLPVFLRRPFTDTLLLRRPLIEKVVPLTVDDELFEVISKSIDLKPIPFKKTADAFKFYETHFPLLLTRITKEGERCSTPSKRSRTPDSPMTIMIQRQRLLNQRLVDLECMMVDMENETEDCLFITELHDPVFNPTKWKWNKMDVGALRRRYTIDASLKEM